MNIETMSQDQVAEGLRIAADAINLMAEMICEMARIAMKAIALLARLLLLCVPIFCGAPARPRSWAEAKRIWRRHGG